MAPSWCTRHRTCHNITPPPRPIVFIVFLPFVPYCFTWTVSSTPHKSQKIFLINSRQAHFLGASSPYSLLDLFAIWLFHSQLKGEPAHSLLCNIHGTFQLFTLYCWSYCTANSWPVNRLTIFQQLWVLSIVVLHYYM